MGRTLPDPMQGIALLERGWLSSNAVLMADDDAAEGSCLLLDSGHVVHATQTVALLDHALAGRPLARLLNTHLHSDHCGGNAALARRHGMPISVPATQARAVDAWDVDALTYRPTGQWCTPFRAQQAHGPGEELRAAGRTWQWISAPGHDPHALMLFDPAGGVLVSGDALWAQGFGVVFEALEGSGGFDSVEAVLDLIGRLPVRVVLPGHGAAFDDVAGALARARQRLAGFRADPRRHTDHAARVLLKYHLMEVGTLDDSAFDAWVQATPMLARLQQMLDGGDRSTVAWARALAMAMAERGALVRTAGGWADA